LIAWEIFALIYYGFPFPNTYYAKLHAGIPASELMEQGFIYFLHTFNADPLTLIAITTALIFVVLMRTRDKLPIAIGVLLYLIYIMRIGGDFMSGRFFAAPLVMSVGLLTRYRLPSIPATIVAAAAVVLMGWIPESPNLLSDSQYGKGGAPGIQDTGIVDERAWYYPETGLLRKSRKKDMPAHHWLRRGVENRWKERRVKSASVIGFEGFASGPDVHIIDGYALTDPLLARLPTYRKRDWRTGHYSRSLPAGYLASIRSGKNLVADSSVAAYWDKLVWITRGKVFRMGRFVRIVKMNLGLYDGLLYDYLHPPRLYAKYADISTPVGRGTPWDCDQCVEIRTSGIEIALDSMCRSERIELSVDHNDHYRLALYHDSTEVGFIKIKRVKIPEGGLRVDTVVVPETALWAGYNRLWLYAWTGDDMYSLGHIRLLDDKGK
jgi:arabinofuranosyltransferase